MAWEFGSNTFRSECSRKEALRPTLILEASTSLDTQTALRFVLTTTWGSFLPCCCPFLDVGFFFSASS